MNKVSALSLLSNAVLVWNTVRTSEIVRGFERTTAESVEQSQLAHVSPLAHAHVIPSDTYHFDRDRSVRLADAKRSSATKSARIAASSLPSRVRM